MTIAISVENISKSYRLGAIGGGTVAGDLSRWWASLRGKPNPLLKIGQEDLGNEQAESIWALHDVSFAVKQGEAVGIIGRNGAGKSTLLKILSRVTAPTSGLVKARGRIASLLEVGTGFHPELTGRENVYLNGAIMGMSRAEVSRKFDEIVDFSGVEKFIDTPVKRYSSGMYVRLAFAVAAHLEPEILIIDEVLAVGDTEFQKKCLGKMGDVAHQGRTVLFVSHNMQAIRSLCSQAILLKKGQLYALGETDAIIQNYLDEQKQMGINEDIAVSMHQVYPPAFEILRVKLMNHSGEASDRLLIQEPFEFQIFYRINNAEESYRVGVHFRGNDGAILGLVHGGSAIGHIRGESGPVYQTSFKSTNIFMPGIYSADIFVKNQAGALVDFIGGLQFSVDALSFRNETIFLGGYVHIDAKWTAPSRVLQLS